MLNTNTVRWTTAVGITWVVCVAFNLSCDFWLLNQFLSFRSGATNPKLTDVEYGELLSRAGGVYEIADSKADSTAVQLPDGVGPSTALGPRERLFERLGIAISFMPQHTPTSCLFKWYPESRRKDGNTGTIDLQKVGREGPDRQAFNLELKITDSGNKLVYRYMFGDSTTEYKTMMFRGHSLLWPATPFDRSLPIQPVSVEKEFHELVADFPGEVRSLYESQRWREIVLSNGTRYSAQIAIPNEEEAAQISRVLEGMIIQVFSVSSEPGRPRPNRQVPLLRKQTLASRIVNGSNELGWIQFLIGIVIARGMISAFRSAEEREEDKLAKMAVETLPALGFLGTLLGMALAFASGLENRNNLTQSLTLAISTSAIALIGALIILWIRRKLD